MKIEVKKELKDQGKEDLFTDERYEFIKSLMKNDYRKNIPLRGYLAIDPAHKVKYIVDHIIKFYE